MIRQVRSELEGAMAAGERTAVHDGGTRVEIALLKLSGTAIFEALTGLHPDGQEAALPLLTRCRDNGHRRFRLGRRDATDLWPQSGEQFPDAIVELVVVSARRQHRGEVGLGRELRCTINCRTR